MEHPESIFEAVGGTPWFVEMIDRFYDGVQTDLLLRPMYPDDLTESREHMVLFLQQYFGGPTMYSDNRGHPRLRMRHAPFIITSAEKDAWLKHMIAAVQAGNLDPVIEGRMLEYFEMAATHMINR